VSYRGGSYQTPGGDFLYPGREPGGDRREDDRGKRRDRWYKKKNMNILTE